MKKLIVLLTLILVVHTSYAQLETYGRYTINGKAEPDINIFGTKKISDKLNLTYLAVVEQKWSEALIGVSYSPQKWISIGLNTGIEHNPAIYRFRGSIWLGKDKISLLMLGEKGDGKGKYWYKTVLSYKASETFTVGAIAWRFHGVGPVVKYTPKKSDLTMWFMPAYDPEFKAKRLIAGLSVKM